MTVVPQSGTGYDTQYSKYGRGKLTAKVHLEKHTHTPVICDGEVMTCNGETLYSGLHCFADYEVSKYVSKYFGIPDGANDNAVVGPVCVKPGERVTYSIAPWITMLDPEAVGYDKYVWFPDGIPSGLVKDDVLYYSADKSSITFDVGDNPGGDTIRVQVGECNVPGNVLSLALLNTIPEPVITPSSCLPAGISTRTFGVSNAVSGVNYTWSVDDNWTIADSATGDSVRITIDATNAAWVYVTAEYDGNTGCQSVSSRTRVSRSLDPDFSAITAEGGSCHAVGDEVTITLNGAPSPAKFVWELPAGWSITGATDSTATIKITSSASAQSSGTLRVAVAGCEAEQETSLPELTLNVKPGNAGDISISGGSLCVERNGIYTLSTTAVSPAPVSYQWVFGSGWTNVQYAADGLSVTATATGSNLSATVTPLGVNGCNGASKTVTAAYPPKAITDISMDKTCLNSGDTDQATFTLKGGDDATYYVWNFDGLMSGSSQTVTTASKSTTVQTSGIDGTHKVYVTAYTTNNVCNSVTSDTLDVTISGLNFTVTEYSNGDGTSYYELTPIGWNFRQYTMRWMLGDTDVTYINQVNQTDDIGSGLLNSVYDNFYVVITPKNDGCTTTKSIGGNAMKFTVRRRSITQSENVESLISSYTSMSLTPNPANSTIRLALSDMETPVTLSVLTTTGASVKRITGFMPSEDLDISFLPTGSYIVAVWQNYEKYSCVLVKK